MNTNNKPTIQEINSLDITNQEKDSQGRFNPFRVDHFLMGLFFSRNVMFMFENHEHEKAKYLILVNRTTGERMEIDFPESWQ